jgi:iron complex transport system substrate-binding protein
VTAGAGRRSATVATGVLLAAAGCHAPAHPGGAAQADAPPRIVSLHDVTTEILVALGATDRLVGAGRPVQVPPEVGAALAQVPRVGDTESIVASRPTLVLGTSVVAREAPALVTYLRDVGIEVVLLDPRDLDDVYDGVLEVARRAKVPEAGARVVARLRARVGAAAAVAPEPVRVFVYDCCDPPFTAARRTVLSDLIARAGGRNIFTDLDASWTRVSWEDVIAQKPQLVVIHAYREEEESAIDKKRARLRAMPALADVPVTVMPLGFSLGGIRSVDGLEHLRRALAGLRG